MKNFLLLLIIAISLAACDTFGAPPQPFPVWTAIPTRTPEIVTATSIIIPPATIADTPTTTIPTPNSETPVPTYTSILSTPTNIISTITLMPSIQVDILGCNTSFDITHGMGEVTNAYITVKNTGGTDLPNTCSLLRAIDEDREHPDKRQCVANLPAQSQVNLKLTVDSQYKVDTVIQVDITSNELILLRLDKQSCRDINLFGGAPPNLGIVTSISP